MVGAREDLRERERPRRAAATMRRIGLRTITDQRRLRLATRLLDLYVRSGAQRLVRASRLLPKRLRAMEALAMKAEGTPYVPVERPDADTAFFAGCIMRTAFGETERATVRMLERGGRRVTACQEQTCCGALHAHAGDGESARDLARANIDAFSGTHGPIVVNAAGCGAQLKAYGELLADDAAWRERAHAFSARVQDASQALSPAAVQSAAPRAIRVVYQDACHLAHGQKIRREPRALLAAMPNVTLVPITDAERCCGSAGIYNITHPEVAGELQRQKIAAILAARSDIVVSANPGCILQVAAGLRAAGSDVPVVHLMRFLDDPSASLGASSG
jgi:glycolate oxidase iron-sulfur subunit